MFRATALAGPDAIGFPQISRHPELNDRAPKAAVARRNETIRLVDDELLHDEKMLSPASPIELIKAKLVLSTSMLPLCDLRGQLCNQSRQRIEFAAGFLFREHQQEF